jgi:hypothetical protein
LNRIYSIGGGKGREAVGEAPNVALAWRYIGLADTWEPIASMPSGVGDAAAVFDGNGHIFVIGGIVAVGGSRTPNVCRYDIASNSWSNTAIPDMPVAINGARAVLGANGWIYVIGGETGPITEPTMLQSTWIFRPDLNSWSSGPDMAVGRRYHGAALGYDGFIYVVGGENTSGGISSCERLFTPSCPTFNTQPDTTSTWLGQMASFDAVAVGGSPISYQWYRNGSPLSDGALGTSGTTVSGSTGTHLEFSNVTSASQGFVYCVATNPCGSVESNRVKLIALTAPNVTGQWRATLLHPAWAEHSYATGVSNGVQAGYGVRDTAIYNNIDLACTWQGSPSSCQTFSGPNSVGGAFYGIANGLKIGYWWWPYQVYSGGQWLTAYSKQACAWKPDGTFVNLQYSGWEYSHAMHTDGNQIVGTISTDDAVGNYYSAAMLWSPNANGGFNPIALGGGYSLRTSASFVYEGKQYGTWSRYGVQFDGYHPCKWSGTSTSLQDLPLTGTPSSGHLGQLGGSVSNRATIWTLAGNTPTDIHPAGYVSSSIRSVFLGVQVGSAQVGTSQHAGIWAGSAGSFVDLHAYLPLQYIASYATGVEVVSWRRDPVITVVGSAYNTLLNRYEAVMWKMHNRSGGGLGTGPRK